jgi:hypothetical protein
LQGSLYEKRDENTKMSPELNKEKPAFRDMKIEYRRYTIFFERRDHATTIIYNYIFLLHDPPLSL